MRPVFTEPPPTLPDPMHNHVPEPADGKAFRPAGETWVDPNTGEFYVSNGHGHFEGCPSEYTVRERPNHGLVRGEPSSADYGRLVEFATSNNVSAYQLDKLLKQAGVEFKPFSGRVAMFSGDAAYKNVSTDLPMESFTWGVIEKVKTLIEIKTTGEKEDMAGINDRWKELLKNAADNGCSAERVHELLKRVCADLSISYAVNKTSIGPLEEAVAKEIELIALQNEGKAQAQEPTIAEDEDTEVEAEAEEVKEDVAEALQEFTRETLTVEIPANKEEIQERKDKAIAELTPPDVEVPKESAVPFSQPEVDEAEEVLNAIKLDAAFLGLSAEQFDSIHAEVAGQRPLMDVLVLSEFHVKIRAMVSEKNQPQEKAKPPAKTRAAKPAKEKEAKEEKANIPPKDAIFDLFVTNHKTGIAIPFKEAMQRFKNYVDWKAYHAKEIKQCEQYQRGWAFLYLGQLLDIIQAEFLKLHNSGDGTFKKASISTPWGKFKRVFGKGVATIGGAELVDKKKFEHFLLEMQPEELPMYGGAFEVKIVLADDAKLEALLRDGVEIPGYMYSKRERDLENPVGPLKLDGTPRNLNLEEEPADDEDESEESDQEEEQEAA